ncbi:hypothetical protein CWE12_00860 [Aliidiomarina sedimenti]|uniref:DAGKc domain-containing protein n=1 Tax=Aliidiomarina sedimenti TaxID=1933879 RepID=A0ABY0C1G1_9GAMM|nr:YegS/Rv2252/BmrU family lipid kinase [Aliidiomarina sedimenti]RUO31580.1 hypothetical protein CWE12_00860 [Aliidiomarina sedimenti]
MSTQTHRNIVVLHNPALHVRRHMLFKRLQPKLPADTYMFASTGNFAADLKALKAACHDADLLIAVGGDGTLNLAVNAVAHTNTILGVVPAGSGNDFARVWVAGMSAEEIINAALSGETINIDLGKVNDRYFLNNAGVGFDGELVKRLKHRTWPRKLTYISRALQLLPAYQARPIVLEDASQKVNGGLQPNSFMLSIGNGRYFGAGIPITPHARLNDGLLAYTHLKEKRRPATVRCLFRMLLQKHLQAKQVQSGQLTEITVKSSGLAVQVDGEYFGSSPVRIEVCPAALRINKL